MRRTSVLLAVLFLVTVTTACGSVSADRCDQECDCTDCGSREYDECILRADWEEDYNDAYGCDLEYEEYADCEINKARCDADNYFLEPTDCDGERNRLNDCVDDNSSLR
jgi:hypothetical protein